MINQAARLQDAQDLTAPCSTLATFAGNLHHFHLLGPICCCFVLNERGRHTNAGPAGLRP